MVQNYTNTY